MPELPEVETVRKGLMQAMQGRSVRAVKLNRSDLRVPLPQDFAARLRGQTIEAVERRAKYLILRLSGGESLIVHLGMSGHFTVLEPDGRMMSLGDEPGEPVRTKKALHDHVEFLLDDGTQVIYTDPRRFGLMDLCATSDLANHPLTRDLGIEPLGGRLTASFLAGAFAGKKAPVKALLMDQRLIAGLGNIYVCEALFRARLSPKRRAGSLVRSLRINDPRLVRLARAIRQVLIDAIAAGGSTLRDHQRLDGSVGAFQHRFSVYGRENERCLRKGCGGRVRRVVQSGRSTFYCPRCQH
jgi:formamidopyrimidine-DNA glycosylase